MKGFTRCQFTDKAWGVCIVWYPHHTDSPWGVLGGLIGTPWEKMFPVVNSADIRHALKGHTIPLLNSLGRDPRQWGKALTDTERICSEKKTCPNFDAKVCWPCEKTPDCYIPVSPTEDQDLSLILTQIALRWRDGQYVVIAQ